MFEGRKERWGVLLAKLQGIPKVCQLTVNSFAVLQLFILASSASAAGLLCLRAGRIDGEFSEKKTPGQMRVKFLVDLCEKAP